MPWSRAAPLRGVPRVSQRRYSAWLSRSRHGSAVLVSDGSLRDGLDPLKGLPIDAGRIAVLHHDPPLVPRQARHDRPSVGRPRGAGAAIREGAGVCGVPQHPADRTRGGRRPSDVAARLAPRQIQPAGAQAAHHHRAAIPRRDVSEADRGRRALLEEAAEHQLHAALHGTVGVLCHCALGTTREPRQQCQRQVAALGLAQQAGGQAAAQRVQLDLGDGPLQAQKQAAVGRARIIRAHTLMPQFDRKLLGLSR